MNTTATSVSGSGSKSIAVSGFREAGRILGIAFQRGLLILVINLPVTFAARIALILTVGTLLITLRMGAFTTPWSRALWPILGSMFMFRLIIYYLRHESRNPGWVHTLGYFFMAPNVRFPLFPIIDYKRFQRIYCNEDASRKLGL